MSFSPSFPTLNNSIVEVKEPRALAGLGVKPPAIFLPDENGGERFFGLTAHISSLFVLYGERAPEREWWDSSCIRTFEVLAEHHPAIKGELLWFRLSCCLTGA